jgi:predicted secreted protein
MGGPLGLRLTIHNIADSAAPTVLQEDRSLPKSRGCVTEYSIAQVILNGTDLVVLVRKASVGFEGSDYRYLAVTGQPKLEE